MLSLDECATRLSLNYLERAGLNKTIWQAGQELVGRERALRPDTGWPGKNDEARQAAKEAALGDDQAYQNAIAARDAANHKLATLDADIAGVEAERRAAEWRIRERMVELLARGGINTQSRGDRAEAVFDDVQQSETDRLLEAVAAGAVVGDPDPLFDDGAFPF